MRAALIPPKGYESTALLSDIHLVLPLPPLVDNADYIRTYARARQRGDYIILDNGCAEGQLVNNETLLAFARKIGAHEIVAPDVMGDANATYMATMDFLKDESVLDYNIMAVVQGNQQTRYKLLDKLAEVDAITTLGIPKVYVRHYLHDARLKMVERIDRYYPGRFKIHLLGLNKAWPTEILDTPYPTTVRSMDSAQPYKVTEAGRIMDEHEPWYKRRSSYFETKFEVEYSELLKNIDVFINWAKFNES